MNREPASAIKSVLLAATLAVATAVLYLPQLGSAPMHLSGDEVKFGAQAYAIATTGRDLNGARLPLFFSMTDPLIQHHSTRVWFQPMLFYLVAAALTVRPLGESSIRVPAAIIGIVDVVLMFAIARRLFGGLGLATAASALLALSPAHFIFSRVSADYICSLPFVLGWLWCLVGYDGRQLRGLFGAGLLLGIGVYSYIAAWVMMPLYLLITCVFVWMVGGGSRSRALSAVGAGFALPAVPFVWFVWREPSMLRDTLARYGVLDAHDPWRLVASAGHGASLAHRLSVYWDYFNPAYLFLAGGSNILDSTRRAGLFLVPVAALLVVGIVSAWRRRTRPVSWLLLVGFATAPAAAVLLDQTYCADRELFVLPFAVLLSVGGLTAMYASRSRMLRLAALALCAAVAVQFVWFRHDYLTGYPARSAGWFDPHDFRRVAAFVVADDRERRVPAIYLAPAMTSLEYAAYRWKFYTQVYRRDDLFSRTQYLHDASDVAAMSADSLVLVGADDPALPALLRNRRCAIAATITDAAGAPATVILRIAA